MAGVELIRDRPPSPPPVKEVRLTLTPDEAADLIGALGALPSTSSPNSVGTQSVYNALANADIKPRRDRALTRARLKRHFSALRSTW